MKNKTIYNDASYMDDELPVPEYNWKTTIKFIAIVLIFFIALVIVIFGIIEVIFTAPWFFILCPIFTVIALLGRSVFLDHKDAREENELLKYK